MGASPLLFHPNFRSVPLGLEDPKLIIRVINFELVQYICPQYVNVTDRRTDGRTDDLRQQYCALHYVHRAVKMEILQAL